MDTMGDMDTVGEDMMQLGAPPARHALAHRAAPARFSVARPHWLPAAMSAQGVSVPKEEMDFLPFDTVTFTSTSGTALTMTALPQRPFRGERIVASAIASIGGVISDALFRVSISPALYVGAVQVGATQGNTPLTAFANNAFGVRLSMPTAGQGTRIAVPLTVTGAIAGGDSITVQLTLIGRAMRLRAAFAARSRTKGRPAMRIRLAIPDRHVGADVLNAALEATTLANESLLHAGEAPLATEAIKAGVKWKPEPFHDGEHFDLATETYERGWGDCDDLASWLAAELRSTGADPGAKAVVKRTGPSRWHAVVQLSDGTVVDPSEWAGMPKKEKNGHAPAVHGTMCLGGHGGIAVVPYRNGYAARADLPWGRRDHVSGLGYGYTREEALERALTGACTVGDAIGLGECVGVASEIGEVLLATPHELDGLFDSIPGIGPALSSITSNPLVQTAANVAMPGAGTLLSAFGGGGTPAPPPTPGAPAPVAPPGMAAAPFPMTPSMMAAPAGEGGGRSSGDRQGTIAWNPNSPGPIIVRFLR